MGPFVLAFLALAQIMLVQAMAIRSDPPDPTTLVRTADESLTVVHRTIADPPSSWSRNNDGGVVMESSSEGENEAAGVVAQPPAGIGRLQGGRRHSHSVDKSVAGGGVIIGGLVTVVFAAVYSYIRVTGRRPDVEKH